MKKYILAWDVGGTNTSAALFAVHDSTQNSVYNILKRYTYATQALPSFETAFKDVLSHIDKPLHAVCVCAAGPAHNEKVTLTNVPWDIHALPIQELSKTSVLLINDFTAISYGIPLLNVYDKQRVYILRAEQQKPASKQDNPQTPNAWEETPKKQPAKHIYAVVGAGTGLGTGCIIETPNALNVLSSEAGHSSFAPYDSLSMELWQYLHEKHHGAFGAELVISGQGIENIYRFFYASGRIPSDSVLHTIQKQRNTAAVSAAAVSAAAEDGDKTAQEIICCFIRNYARFASDTALHYLPNKGLYLAGGIAAKTLRWVTHNDIFLHTFSANYRPNITETLQRIPLYVITDYEISVYGAAHAAANILL